MPHQQDLGRFVSNDINLAQNSTHQMVPDWSDFEELQLIIYIDEGNNGTIDDTLEVANALSTTTFPLTVSVDDGWNMVSVPGINPDGQGVAEWWSGRVGEVFEFNGGYQIVDSAQAGEGYWMKNSGAQTYNTGDEWPAGGIEIVPHDPIAGVAGWNLIGGYENSAAVSGITTNPPGLVDGPVYGYSGGYTTPSTMEPGYGYWIKLSAAGDIILPDALAKGTESVEWFKDDWGRIVMTDATGKKMTLYAVNGEVNLNQLRTTTFTTRRNV